MLRSHVDWLLGDEVAELRAMTSSGQESIWPGLWFRHELEVRKEAMRQLNTNGVSLPTAFASGRKNDELPTRYLITPLALGGATRDTKMLRPSDAQQPRNKPQAHKPVCEEATRRAERHTRKQEAKKSKPPNKWEARE